VKIVTTIGTLVGVGAVVVAWVYRTASVRLGVVDLFASEITTLCRVGKIVDVAQRSVAAFENVDRSAHSRTPARPRTMALIDLPPRRIIFPFLRAIREIWKFSKRR
jgi:hypothetical protein